MALRSHRANVARSHLHCPALSLSEPVTHWTTLDSNLVGESSEAITVITQEPLQVTALMKERVYLNYEDRHYRHGIIASCHFLGNSREGYHYDMVIQSLLYPLSLRLNYRVFHQLTPEAILTALLLDAGMTEGSFSFTLKKTLPQISLYIQFNETNAISMQRLLAHFNLWIIWEQTASTCRCVITDHWPKRTVKTVVYGETAFEASYTLPEGRLTFNTDLSLSVGDAVRLKEYNSAVYEDTQYRVIASKVRVDQTAGKTQSASATMTDTLQVTLIPTTQSIPRPLLEKNPHYFFPAEVLGMNKHTPYLDGAGKSQVRLLFDETNDTNSIAFMTVLQPFNGMHFPLLAGSLVVVSCVPGELSEAFVVAGLPNAESPSPVSHQHKDHNVIRTASGNTLTLQGGKTPAISLQTPVQQQSLVIGGEGGGIALQSDVGGISFRSHQDVNYVSGTHLHFSIGKAFYSDVKERHTVYSKENIAVQAKGSVRFRSEQQLAVYSQNGSIHCQTERHVQLSANKQVIVQSQGGLRARAKRNVTLSGQSVSAYAEKSVTLSNGLASITIGQGKVQLHAHQIVLAAPVIIR